MARAPIAPIALPMLLCLVSGAAGHGAMVAPLSRNAIDRFLHADVNASGRHLQHCGCANATTGKCRNGQACFWYSQGCTIGCPSCDNVTGRMQTDLCGLGKRATLNDPLHRSVNRAAAAGSDLDVYKHNPWRAPGTAPVVDACGMAGGSPGDQWMPEWGFFTDTTYAKKGDLGTHLPEVKTATVWRAGSVHEAVWQVEANHGGGYQYRLCPKTEAITEACFQMHPLPFAGSQFVQLSNGTRFDVKPTYVSDGTSPAGSTWALNPIPARCLSGKCHEGKQCTPPEPGNPDQTPCDDTPEPAFEPPCPEGSQPGLCSGNQPSEWMAAAVVDTIQVPKGLPPGEYVLGWRWDCEATAQVWSNCADLTIVAADSPDFVV